MTALLSPHLLQPPTATLEPPARLREIPYNYTSFSDREIVIRLLGGWDRAGAGLSFRTATGDERAWVLAADPIGATDARRNRFLGRAVADKSCEIALVGGERAGFAVWHRQFFSRPFLALLIVLPAHRRRGTGTRLVRHLVERLAQGDTFFTSTNESNVAAQRFFEKLGFVRSGRIENLDPGDPELIYALPPDR